MSCSCSVSKTNLMFLSCSGGSNVGQLSNRAAVELTQEGFGKMSCLAGIGGRLNAFVQSARDAPVIAAIDGCSVGCAKAILMNADIRKFNHIVLTDHGLEKNKNMVLTEEDVSKVKDIVRTACSDTQARTMTEMKAANARCCE